MEKILVVNNDIDTMSLLKNLLERKNYQVTYTSNVEEAMRFVRKERPAAVLVDVLQKTVLQLIKEDEAIKQVPVILMTGYSVGERQGETLADDVIEKPFLSDLLLVKLGKHAGNRSIQSTIA